MAEVLPVWRWIGIEMTKHSVLVPWSVARIEYAKPARFSKNCLTDGSAEESRNAID